LKKRTLVLGASTNPDRYSYRAVIALNSKGHEVIPMGIKKGEIIGIPILNEKEPIEGVDTISLYLGPQNQKDYEDYIVSLSPNRVIFNPGTINYPFIESLESKGIEVLDACTLVMLSVGSY